MARMKSPSDERADPRTHAAVLVESLLLIGHRAQKLRTPHAAREDRIDLLEIIQYRSCAELIDFCQRTAWEFESLGRNETHVPCRVAQLPGARRRDPDRSYHRELDHRRVHSRTARFNQVIDRRVG